VPPAAIEAQAVPTQHTLCCMSQLAPAPAQTAPLPSPVQTPRPGGPVQSPPQQSSGATHAAPSGAQALRQVKPPAGSGRQRPPQHWASTRQGLPSAAQPDVSGRQRMRPDESAPQAVPVQQSPAFMQSCPRARHGGIASRAFAQRPTSCGAEVQLPEQHSAPALHRSCSGWQPGSRWHRLGPDADASQRPEQQSLSFMHRESAALQPGSGWHRASSPGMLTQWPPQQSELATQVSPSTRQASRSWQRALPLSVGLAQVRPQQSMSPAQLSPAGRQPAGSGAQDPAMHAPAQQSWATAHAAPDEPQAGAPQIPATQPSEQHVPA